MNNMDKYAEIIIRILKEHHIEGVYDSANDMVYIYREDKYGTVYNLFGCCNNLLENRLICTMYIQEGEAETVQACLSDINRLHDSGMFYIDSDTGCLAYAVDYVVPPDGIRYGDHILARFCTQAWKTYTGYRETLYRVITRQA
ncbi:hypothetical protein [Dysgonomonas sp. HGC4]|uniref:hypothetical protein n=1 Tax=Dysgonomonas sp. HGC4 TaxID=1658009 RepID=UPI0006827E58|nr:hypothetical protein [Dysgonomonas sp. HGC4]MBD8349952.1 hypothetical protein [Dysgonomonas sp. HGC4]